MKKIILIILTLAPFILKANPVWEGASISEIYFDESGNWTLEIDNYNMGSVEWLDSLKLETNSGIATITNFDTTDYIVINNSNLSDSISINKNSDFITLYSYSAAQYKVDTIAIGSLPNSYLEDIENGQSIARLWGYGPFYKDNSPTIGAKNDLEGTKGKIYGYFYDTNGEKIKNKYFFINEGYCTTILQEQGYDGNITIDNNGFYVAEITSRSYSINKREIYESSSNYDTLSFQEVNFELNENDSIRVDFKQLSTNIDKLNKDNILLTNYPNPASGYTYFIFDSKYHKHSHFNILISLYSINGEKIDSFYPNSSKHRYDCSHLNQGTYVYTLSFKGKILTSSKLQVVK
jgi:predicted nuclease of predicted toxin-antitoxin system